VDLSRSLEIVAEGTRRVCRGIEIDPTYVDVAIWRWRRMTGDPVADFAALEVQAAEAAHV
jgi:DNA modification methylase